MISNLQRPPHVSAEQWERALCDFATYRRELPRLLQEGHAGRIAIIRNDQVVGIRDTIGEALQEADDRFATELVATFKINPLDVDRLGRLDKSAKNKEPTCPS